MIPRAGDLDRTIQIARATAKPLGKGRAAQAPTLAPVFTLRAKLIQATASDMLRSGGSIDDTTRIFLTRWVDGIAATDQVTYLGATYKIAGITEIGRREALQLRCEVAS